jgi:ATP-dependent DNA ligase
MLARLERELPEGDFLYEPKWDGFRCIAFRAGDEVELGSRNELALARYFPELVEVMRQALPPRVVLDGEVVVAGPAGLDFELLGQRVHPAESRVRMLAARDPASFVAFDLLCLGDRDLRQEPFHRRRSLLEEVLAPLADRFRAAPAVHLTPATRDVAEARDWFSRFEGAGLDGVVAKAADLRYVAGKRLMVKVKHERTAEFVVGGFRWYKGSAAGSPPEVGSLLLGLYDNAGHLAHVGVIGAFPLEQRRALVDVLQPLRALPPPGPEPSAAPHPWAEWAGADAAPAPPRAPGARSRWNASKDLSFEPVRPELVVEAAYEHLQGHRLRHTARFRRWRPDRRPVSCTYTQLEAVVPLELAEVFGAGVVTRAAPPG